MVEFTPAILAHLVISGYKGLKVENTNGKYVIIEPTTDVDSIEEMTGNNSYIIPICDHQAVEMTGKVLLLDLKFFIDEKYIE